MSQQTAGLTRQFLAWVDSAPRTYADAMDAWRSSCPRLTIWEDALADGLIRIEPNRTRAQARIALSERGHALLHSTD
jgi:hypothetical protein